MTGAPLWVVVPARDEARVIADKVRDLALQRWPSTEAGRPHRIVIVDDHSADGTAAVAAEAIARASAAFAAARVVAVVVPNAATPGKPGAIRAGLGAAGASDAPRARAAEGGALVVLTDADVRLAPGALSALADAFAREPRLGMACGAQRYETADGASDMGLYDRVFALLRALESRCGALLSVHGQLLAWRSELELAPPDGEAADDLWLAVRARDRAAPLRVALVRAAVFIERRAAPGAPAHAQALRRARAWFQHFAGPPPRRRVLRLQWRLWGQAPTLFSLAVAPLAPFVPGIAARRRLLREARAAERAAPLAARWEVARG